MYIFQKLLILHLPYGLVQMYLSVLIYSKWHLKSCDYTYCTSTLSTQDELYISFTDYSTGFGGTYGVQTDRVDKVIKHVQFNGIFTFLYYLL